MKAIAKVPIVFAVACLWASVIATTITFPLDFWLLNPTSSIRYGMWTLCQDLKSASGGTLCYSFYDAQTQNNLTNYYKAFQGFQCGMLGFSTLALFFILINLAFCLKCWVLFLLDAILITFAIGCATVSLLIYGIKIYDSSVNILGWCFWLSVGSGGLLILTLFFLTIYLFILGLMRNRSNAKKSKSSREIATDTCEYEAKTIRSVPSYRQLNHHSVDNYPLEISPPAHNRYIIPEQEYRNSKRWQEPPLPPPNIYQARQNSIKSRQQSIADVNPNWSYYESNPQYVTRSQV